MNFKNWDNRSNRKKETYRVARQVLVALHNISNAIYSPCNYHPSYCFVYQVQRMLVFVAKKKKIGFQWKPFSFINNMRASGISSSLNLNLSAI